MFFFCRDIIFPKEVWKNVVKQSQKKIAGNIKGHELHYEAVVNGIREAINDIWCNELRPFQVLCKLKKLT